MKRLIVSCILTVLLVGGAFWSEHALHSSAEDLAAGVDAARSAVQQTDWTAAAEALGESYTVWTDKQTLLGSLIRHTELDQIDALYLRALQALDNRDEPEALLHTRELSGLLRRVSELERPNLRNIL